MCSWQYGYCLIVIILTLEFVNFVLFFMFIKEEKLEDNDVLFEIVTLMHDLSLELRSLSTVSLYVNILLLKLVDRLQIA
jgi:hypothetical protein